MLFDIPCIRKSFHWLLDSQAIPGPLWAPETVPFALFLFSGLIIFSHAGTDQFSAKGFRWIPYRSLEFFLCVCHSPRSSTLLTNRSCLVLPECWTPFPSLSELAGCYVFLPFLYCGLDTLQVMSWGPWRSHLICFSSLRDHSATMPVVHSLKTVVLYIWSFLVKAGE